MPYYLQPTKSSSNTLQDLECGGVEQLLLNGQLMNQEPLLFWAHSTGNMVKRELFFSITYLLSLSLAFSKYGGGMAQNTFPPRYQTI